MRVYKIVEAKPEWFEAKGWTISNAHWYGRKSFILRRGNAKLTVREDGHMIAEQDGLVRGDQLYNDWLSEIMEGHAESLNYLARRKR